MGLCEIVSHTVQAVLFVIGLTQKKNRLLYISITLKHGDGMC